jgi:hypothetical protein
MSKKIKKLKKPRKLKKKTKKTKLWKKTSWFGFGFISLKLKKPNWTQTKKTRKKTETNRKKTKPNRKNRAKPVWTGFVLKNRTETGRFKPVLVFFKKNISVWFFFIKTKPNKKWSPLILYTCLVNPPFSS